MDSGTAHPAAAEAGTGDPVQGVTEATVARAVAGLESRNIDVTRASTRAAAADALIAMIEPPARVLSGGSRTIAQLDIPARLRLLDGVVYVNDEVRAVNDGPARYDLRRHAGGSDVVIGSANAIVSDGRIVNVDAGGSRISAYAYSARRVVLVVSTNKICPSLDAAVERVRAVAVRRIRDRDSDQAGRPPCYHDGVCREELCRPPQRECGKMLIIEKEAIRHRIHVILIDQPAGF
jgi:hypothetical protein